MVSKLRAGAQCYKRRKASGGVCNAPLGLKGKTLKSKDISCYSRTGKGRNFKDPKTRKTKGRVSKGGVCNIKTKKGADIFKKLGIKKFVMPKRKPQKPLTQLRAPIVVRPKAPKKTKSRTLKAPIVVRPKARKKTKSRTLKAPIVVRPKPYKREPLKKPIQRKKAPAKKPRKMPKKPELKTNTFKFWDDKIKQARSLLSAENKKKSFNYALSTRPSIETETKEKRIDHKKKVLQNALNLAKSKAKPRKFFSLTREQIGEKEITRRQIRRYKRRLTRGKFDDDFYDY